MRIDILTTFVEMFTGPLDESIMKRAREAGLVEIQVHNLRNWTSDRHHKTDDEQYGGGDGMVMLAEPLITAVEDLASQTGCSTDILLTTPQGELFNQEKAEAWSLWEHLLIICGHYKGIDQRVIDYLQPEEVSIGDFILTGGELPAMIITDAIVRLIPGVVGSYGSVQEDSFTSGLLDCPRYTRPREIRGLKVPEVLLSGNHAEIEKWRQKQSYEKTAQRRPDLLDETSRKSKKQVLPEGQRS